MSNPINFLLNGTPTQADCRADMTVLEWLRGEALLRGTKEGCAEGDCGACSVLIKRAGSGSKGVHLAANSCIMLMGQIDGAELVTVEGLSNNGKGSHIVQARMAENGSSQCGFCTPGIAVSLAGLLERNSNPNDADIHDALAGNLCRCTGYRPIVEAAHSAAKGARSTLPAGKVKRPSGEVGLSSSKLLAPTSLKDMLALRQKHKKAVLLAGGTDIALAVAHAKERWPVIISTRNVKELRAIKTDKSSLTFGGAVTWEEALPHIEKFWPSFATLVRRFGSTQVRSMGTIAGNLATASPIGDGAPALLSLNASLVLASAKGDREVALDKFFTGYRQSALKNGEVISQIKVPLPAASEVMRVYKVSKRYDQDISTVCGAFNLNIEGEIVKSARIAFGGMAATPLRCKAAEQLLIGGPLNEASIQAAKQAIADTFEPMTDMRGSAEYRAMVAGNLLERFALHVAGNEAEVSML